MPPRIDYRFYKAPGEHPMRRAPETLKEVTPDISLFKTLLRVARFWDGVDNGVEHAISVGDKLMPWVRKHITRHRNEINTAEKMHKHLVDLCCAVKKTQRKYCPPYPHPKLSSLKKEEVLLASKLIRKGRPVPEGFAKQTMRYWNDH